MRKSGVRISPLPLRLLQLILRPAAVRRPPSLPFRCRLPAPGPQLDSPRDLYHLAFASKHLMSLLTPECVIRSAVFHNLRRRDKGPRKVAAHVLGYVGNRSIHVPSARRLLRLLCAKSCEMGDRCWGRNLDTGRAAALPPGNTTRPFGLALCDKCVKFGTTKVPYSHFGRFQRGVAFHQWNLLFDPVVAVEAKAAEGGTAAGTAAEAEGRAAAAAAVADPDPVRGPLVRVLELQQIENTYVHDHDKKAALEGMVRRALTAARGGDDDDRCDGRDDPLHYEDRAAAYQEMWEDAEREADDRVAAALAHDQRQYRARREERLARRMARIRAIHDLLGRILEGCPLRDLALDCQWLEVSDGGGWRRRGERQRNYHVSPVLTDPHCVACRRR